VSFALSLLAAKGYRPLYLSARAEWLTERSRAFLRNEGFPRGILRTTQSALGLIGSAAMTYKTDELSVLAAKGLRPAFAFGNTDTDAQAYHSDDISDCIFYRYSDAMFDGRRIEGYSETLAEFGKLSPACP